MIEVTIYKVNREIECDVEYCEFVKYEEIISDLNKGGKWLYAQCFSTNKLTMRYIYPNGEILDEFGRSYND